MYAVMLAPLFNTYTKLPDGMSKGVRGSRREWMLTGERMNNNTSCRGTQIGNIRTITKTEVSSQGRVHNGWVQAQCSF